MGETIHAVIHAEKLEKARSLLISTSLSINEISQMCGYPSLQYFYSVFRKETHRINTRQKKENAFQWKALLGLHMGGDKSLVIPYIANR